MTRTFTGWHMTTLLVGFFAIVISVNMVMARLAAGTFSGVVVENSYVASQQYNRWLADADRQARLGWTYQLSLDESRHVMIGLARKSSALPISKAFGFAVHPLGQSQPIKLSFRKSGFGTVESEQSLPAGRWRLRLTLQSGDQAFKLEEPVS